MITDEQRSFLRRASDTVVTIFLIMVALSCLFIAWRTYSEALKYRVELLNQSCAEDNGTLLPIYNKNTTMLDYYCAAPHWAGGVYYMGYSEPTRIKSGNLRAYNDISRAGEKI